MTRHDDDHLLGCASVLHANAAPRGLGTLREAVYLFIMTPPEGQEQVYAIMSAAIYVAGDSRQADAEIGPRISKLAGISPQRGISSARCRAALDTPETVN